MMEDKGTAEEDIELITEWPVTSSHQEKDSDTSISHSSKNCYPVRHKLKTGQHSPLTHLRLGKRQYRDILSTKNESEHDHEDDSKGASLGPQRGHVHDAKSWKGCFSRETSNCPHISDSVELDRKNVSALGRESPTRLEGGEDGEHLTEISCLDQIQNGSVVSDCPHPVKNDVDRRVSAGIACLTSSLNQNEDALTDRELLAQPRIARWWRRHGKQLSGSYGQEERTLPKTTNPNTLLFHVARLPEGRAFLVDERQKLRKQSKMAGCKGDVMAALGSIEDWLGNPDEAVQWLKQAVAKEPTNRDWRWLLHKVERQQRVRHRQRELLKSLPLHPVFPPMRQVERISCRDLSFADFFHQYALCRRPVVITDMVPTMTTVPWDLQHIRDMAGDCQARVKRSVAGSVEWAGLEDSKVVRVSEFLDSMEQGCQDYLFDWSLPLHCPRLAEELTIPRYFAGDFLQRTAPGSLYRDSWPSLFIAPPGVLSGLHVDAFASNFWMALFQGSKRWVFFQEEDSPCLYPVYAHSLDPSFEVNMADPDLKAHPLLACIHPVECVLNAGELLFVPGGSPHHVQNLDTTLAISANFVDLSNFPQVLDELDISALLDPRAADLAQQFRHPSFVSAMKADMADRPWEQFKVWPPPDLDSYCLKGSECDKRTSKPTE